MSKYIRYMLSLSTAILLTLLCSSCIVSNLDNGFNPKSPGGLLLYLTGSASSQNSCVFDTSAFDSCTLGD